jgi:hypothetical protein
MSHATQDAEIVSALTAYYEALYYGHPQRLDDAFTPDAVLVGHVNDAAVRLTLDEYRAVLGSRASPCAKGEPYAFAIRDIRLCGGVALAELVTPLNGLVFTDYASLVRRDGKWRIAFKLFSHHGQGGDERVKQ